MFCAAAKLIDATWVHAKIWMNVSAATIWVIPKLPVMAFHGIWFTVSALLIAPMRQKRSDTTNQGGVETNWIDCGCRTVAAATGRGFESRRPRYPAELW